MKKHLLISFIILISLVFLLPDGAFAGQIPFTELQMPSGETGTTGQGDYVSSTGGLNTYLSYFIEVPPGSANLVVELYDADVGNLLPSDIGDRLRTAYNTSVTYTLLTPTGATQVTKTCDSGLNPCILDNGAWTNLATVVNPAAGHWELRVDMGAGDDLNGFAIRAYDPAPLGKEYNIYADSFIDIGVHGAPGPTTNTYSNIFPFITSGCNFSTRDWDMDGGGSISVTSRTGTDAFTQTNSAVSGSTAWLTTTVPETGSGWTTDETAGDYGIWSSNMTVSAGANYTTIYLGQYNAVATPPTSQPQANTFRMYFLGKDLTGVNTAVSATKLVDALANFLNPAALVRTGDIVKNISAGTYTTVTSIDSATQLGLAADIFTTTSQNYSIVSVSPPVKPYLTQILASPIPAVISGKTTRVNIQVTITNPTPFDITFSATNLVTANVPGPTCPAATDSACYAGSSYASVTQGVITGQPAAGGTGNITWNPGTVYAGTNASLTYAVNVAPTATGNRIRVTGIPTSNGTSARYVDETGNTTQARATYTYGPLCELAVTSVTGATGAKRFLRWREVIQ